MNLEIKVPAAMGRGIKTEAKKAVMAEGLDFSGRIPCAAPAIWL